VRKDANRVPCEVVSRLFGRCRGRVTVGKNLEIGRIKKSTPYDYSNIIKT
jgi:hypothetical protein